MKIEPVHLEGRFVRLEPLADAHADGLLACSRDDSIWRYMPFRIEDEEGARGWIAYAAQLLATQEGMLFATVDRATGEVVGSTGFLAPAASHRRVEIGGTWVTPARQRSAVNTEAKLLMLAHAFDAWDCIRVEFKTDSPQREVAPGAAADRRERGGHPAEPHDPPPTATCGTASTSRSLRRVARGAAALEARLALRIPPGGRETVVCAIRT